VKAAGATESAEESAEGAAKAGRPLLEVHDLRTYFDTPRGMLKAVDGVSFSLDRGETIGIVGESGSGKSVLVRSIMNILPGNAIVPDSARVVFDGKDTRQLSRREARHFWGTQMAMIFQDPMTSLNPVKKIGVQITESIRYHLGASRREAVRRALDLMVQVGIPAPRKRLKEYPHQLSGGMRQRVTIAIALACNPKLLIADEPTTALDVTVQKQILDLLASLQEEMGMGMILITHDLGVVAGRAGRIGVMYAGKMVETADTSTLFHHMSHPYTEALFKSIPRVEHQSHTRLDAISGRPPDMVAGLAGCRFAPRCRYAQTRCLAEEPELFGTEQPGHRQACFYPVGSPENTEALAANQQAGITAAGLGLAAAAVS